MDKDTLNVFITLKSLTSGDDGDWIFEGIASTRDMDLQDEVIYPESFRNSVEFFKSNGKIFFEHEYAKRPDEWLSKYGFSKDEILSLKTPIGKPLDAQITDDGLYIKAILNKQHPMARKMWTDFLNNPDEKFRNEIGLSIGAKYLGTPRREYDIKKRKNVTYLPELLLYEVSMTPVPVNPHTWTAAVKSMLDASPNDIQYHTIAPDSVLFDKENERLVIKSAIDNGNGTTHVLETYIDIKEDIRNIMSEDEKVTLKAFPEQEEDKKEESVTTETTDASPVEGGEEVTETVGATETVDAPPAGIGEAPGEGGPLDVGGEVAPGVGGEEGSLLDGLVTGESGAGEEVGAPDASMEMVLDKQDTILDVLGQVLDALTGATMESSTPMEEQTAPQPPAPSTEILKAMVQEAFESNATVNLSEESTQEFTTALKSVFSDFEDRIVEKLVHKLRTETTVVKSVGSSSSPQPQVVINHPGVAITGNAEDETFSVVRKAVEVGGEDITVEVNKVALKSLVNKFTNIRGYTPASVQSRVRVLEEAEQKLGIGSFEFKHYVRMAEKGQL